MIGRIEKKGVTEKPTKTVDARPKPRHVGLPRRDVAPDSQACKQSLSILHQTIKHPAARALFLERPLAEFSLFARLRSSLLASLSPKAGSLRNA